MRHVAEPRERIFEQDDVAQFAGFDDVASFLDVFHEAKLGTHRERDVVVFRSCNHACRVVRCDCQRLFAQNMNAEVHEFDANCCVCIWWCTNDRCRRLKFSTHDFDIVEGHGSYNFSNFLGCSDSDVGDTDEFVLQTVGECLSVGFGNAASTDEDKCWLNTIDHQKRTFGVNRRGLCLVRNRHREDRSAGYLFVWMTTRYWVRLSFADYERLREQSPR